MEEGHAAALLGQLDLVPDRHPIPGDGAPGLQPAARADGTLPVQARTARPWIPWLLSRILDPRIVGDGHYNTPQQVKQIL